MPLTKDKINLFETEFPHKLLPELFSTDGWAFCRRWREDMAAIGVKMGDRPTVATRHLLYSILGDATGPLAMALSTVDVRVKDLHAALTREITSTGRKRNDPFALTRESLFDSVVAVLMEAAKLSREREARGIGEIDIHRAFLAKQAHEVFRLLPKEGAVNLAAVADYLAEPLVDAEEPKPLLRYTIEEIRANLNEKIVGQEIAVERILPWIQRFRFGLSRGGRPAAVFLFLGPTGTGKTQMAKELARYIYGNDEQLLFFEMGQFNTKESVSHFIGAPPGYKGYGEGKLTNGLRDNSECVILFDDIERDHRSVLDVVLRFADEGVVADPAGPVRDARRCIVIMTTNAGAPWLREHLRLHPEARDDAEALSIRFLAAARDELETRGVRPEFLSHVDERVVFLPLGKAACRKIVDRVLAKEIALFVEEGVAIMVPDEVRDILATLLYDRSMDEDARGARRAVKKYIVSPAIDILAPLQNQGRPSPARLMAVVEGGEVILRVDSAAKNSATASSVPHETVSFKTAEGGGGSDDLHSAQGKSDPSRMLIVDLGGGASNVAVVKPCPTIGGAHGGGEAISVTDVTSVVVTPHKTSHFSQVFQHAHVVLPVIHVSSEEQAMRNAAIARDAGCDGVFLINHVIGGNALLKIHAAVVAAFPDWWIGLNCLDLDPAAVFARVTPSVGGIWVDNAMIEEGQEHQEEADAIRMARQSCGWPGLYFGGVAFKYQRCVADVQRAARIARNYMDVVTTSGPGIGKAANVMKIRAMKAALGDFPLAIASGIAPDNIHEYLPCSDCYLVATGIGKTFEELDPVLVRTLVALVRTHDQEKD